MLRCVTVFNVSDIVGFLRHFDGLGLRCSLPTDVVRDISFSGLGVKCVSFSPPHMDHDLLSEAVIIQTCSQLRSHSSVRIHIAPDAIGAHGLWALW